MIPENYIGLVLETILSCLGDSFSCICTLSENLLPATAVGVNTKDMTILYERWPESAIELISNTCTLAQSKECTLFVYRNSYSK